MDPAVSGLERVGQVTRRILQRSANLLFATQCLGCGVLSPALFCENCRSHRELGETVCDLCGLPTSAPIRSCGRCVSENMAKCWQQGRSLWWLDEAARAWIAAVKFEGRFELIAALEADFRRVFHWNPKIDVIVPIPLHPFRLATRGFNQSEKIACWVGSALQVGVETNALVRTANTAPQSLLRRKARLKNLRNHFEVRGASLWGKRVLLVDDVWTSGSTLREAARAVRKGRASGVSVWSLFRTPLRN